MKRFLIAALGLCCFTLCFTSATAQTSEGGIPLTWTNDKVNWNIPNHELEPFDVQAFLDEDEVVNESKDAPYRFGKNFDVSITFDNAGRWKTLPNGDRVWLMSVESEGAKSINLAFDQFYLQPGAKLFMYTEDHAHLIGAFTHKNNAADGLFATYPVPGQKLIIEFYEPASEVGNSSIEIKTITHAYRDLDVVARGIGDSGACNNNVVCAEGDPWENQINAVAMVVVGSNGICTGALINNTANDGHPYFLTADHCTGGGVSNWVFRFNWQSTTCVGNNVGTFQTVNGSTMLAQGGIADYALLEINNGNPIPQTATPYFAGWDATGVNPSNQVAIHHPSGDLKKISFDTDAAGTATYGGATCWRIFNWEDGTTEPGSSGSPLFDQNQRIIGQLYGGQATCANNVNDYYGKFDVTFPFVCQWLAPGCTATAIDGYDPYSPTVSLDAQASGVLEPSGNYCTNTVSPQVNIRNAGTTTLTSLVITYNFDGGANQTFNWTGSLASSAVAAVNLPNITVGDGAHVFNYTVSSPNGGTDLNAANNSASSNFATTSNGVTFTLDILTDNYPAETTWTITDLQGNTLFSGGPYAGQQTNYSFSACLPAACYNLNFFDSFGDGMQYQGVVGDYTLSDEAGNVLVSIIAGGNFGASVTDQFCLVASGVNGCTDLTACNYDPSATTDDGSCEFTSCAGCTNAAACNYDPSATLDNGTCQLPDGCTDAGACNYNPAALCDNGSCEFNSCAGCTNSSACNYNATATIDNGSCQLPDGCTDAGACNYNPAALCDNGSCEFNSCAGCTNSSACNYDATATIDNGSCQLPDGCTDSGACNYNPSATCDNGTCEYNSCAGCTNAASCNYDAAAAIDDGSCTLPNITYYLDNDGDGFGDAANSIVVCGPTTGYVLDNSDCDDNNADKYPNAPSTQEGIDNDCDGIVNQDELATCMGDFNTDGQRNIGDMLFMLESFGCVGNCSGDLNQDQVVNGADIIMFLSFFGTPCN